MSENLKNSNLLQHILDSAEIMKKQKEKKILTVNYVFAAALQFCSDVSSGTISSEFEITEVGTIMRMLGGILLKNDISSCIEQLCVKEETYIDDLLFRQVVALSEKRARDNNKNIVSADIFLSCIMESPTSEIKNIMKSYDIKLCPEGFSNELEGSENTSESNSAEFIENISSTPKEQIVELTKK